MRPFAQLELPSTAVGHAVENPLLEEHAQPQQSTQTVQQALALFLRLARLCYNIFMTSHEENQTTKPQRVFVLVTDNEVFHKLYVEENYEDFGMASLIYGLQSNPIIVDITDKNHEEIDFGWTMDGDSFIPPANSEDL